MNLNQIFNMVLRLFMRRAIGFGIRKGTDMIGRSGGTGRAGVGAAKGTRHTGATGGPRSPADVSRDQAQSDSARQTAKLARKAARITRRLGR